MQTLSRIFAALAALHALAVWVPPPTWSVWMVRFAALELAPLALLTGVAAIALGTEGAVRGLGAVGVFVGVVAIGAYVPAYLRAEAPFSIAAWLGADGPDARRTDDVALADGLVADVYTPDGAGPHPYVVVVHGGSWRGGDKGDVPHVSHALARAGFVVVDVRYRLAPYPAAIVDVRRALSAIVADPARFDVDPARGALLGRSAGGQIALLAAYGDEARFGPAPAVRAVVAVYAPTDLAWDHANPYVPDVVDGTAALEQYLGGPPEAAPGAYRDATPMSWLDRPVPPTLLVHGASERCVRPVNSARLYDALRAKGYAAEALFVPMADHGFDVRRGGLGEQLARHRIVGFLTAAVAPGDRG